MPDANEKKNRNRLNLQLVKIFPMPKMYSRRYGDFTANIHGSLSKIARQVKYRLNDGPGLDIGKGGPRAPAPFFVIELNAHELCPGTNTLTIHAVAYGGRQETTSMQFDYDPQAPILPRIVDWSQADPESIDGEWETFLSENGWRVRPKFGREGYDRIVLVAGAFAAGRRIETEVIFRHKTVEHSEYGFGVIPLWGGHPDNGNFRPRRGWRFSIIWYFNRYKGVGNEFSYKIGNALPTFVTSYRSLHIEAGIPYCIIVECWPEIDVSGRHIRFKQRMKWWPQGTPEPDNWLELVDAPDAPLPAIEYGAALIAYNCQVDFGPVAINPLQARIFSAPDKTDTAWRTEVIPPPAKSASGGSTNPTTISTRLTHHGDDRFL